ncbi:AI-2E family transporter [Orbaceae bacterium ESL0721]|nr:AI-2E family transporter [Orbaceae bacterium ESL0721]
MYKLFMTWYNRRLSNPHVISLLVVIILLFLTIYFFNKILLPILIAIVLSYLLDTPVNFLNRKGIPRTLSVILVLLVFVMVVLVGIMILLPIIWQQGISLIKNIPNMLNFINDMLLALPKRYPELIHVGFFDSIIQSVKDKVVETGNSLLQFSIVSLFSLISIIVNAVLIPVMMFFLLKDKTKILRYCSAILPKNRTILNKVAQEMDLQISNYIVGNVLHIIILTATTYLLFWYFGLDYGLLLAVLVGISVLIPYVGIIIATIPVILIALFQWGLHSEFTYLILFYAVIQMLDGNLLVPLIYSEKLNLPPLVIMLAVIIFGGLWGFWGVFFAIPLATLVKAVINAWPKSDEVIADDLISDQISTD